MTEEDLVGQHHKGRSLDIRNRIWTDRSVSRLQRNTSGEPGAEWDLHQRDWPAMPGERLFACHDNHPQFLLCRRAFHHRLPLHPV